MIERYNAPEPSAMRALMHATVSDEDKVLLRDMLGHADPVLLLAEIRTAQEELGKRVDARGMSAGRSEPPAPIDLAQFTASLKVAWSAGERRPTLRRRYVRVKPVVRTSMLVAVRDQLLAWLEAKPALSAVDALERLRGLHPDRFSAEHLRAVQRFMKVRRLTMAREVLLGPMPRTATLVPNAVATDGAAAVADDIGKAGNITS